MVVRHLDVEGDVADAEPHDGLRRFHQTSTCLTQKEIGIVAKQPASAPHMPRIVPHTVPRVGRSYEHFPDEFEFYLLLLRKYLQGLMQCEFGHVTPQTSAPTNPSHSTVWGTGVTRN